MNVASYNQVAQEGLFTKKKTVEDLLATAQKKVAKLKTVEDVDAKLQAVNESGKQVNTTLRTMADAAKKRAAGSMEEKEFRSTVSEASKSIASPIKTLYAKLGNVVESKASVTSDEIKAFQQYLSGLKKLLMDRKKELAAAPAKEGFTSTGDPDLDAILESLEADLDDAIATEGCGKKCKKTTEACGKKTTEACGKKTTESDDEDCDPDDEECDIDEDDDEEDDEEDEDDDEDSEEEACGESFTASELAEYASACESMMNDDFGFEVTQESVDPDGILNADGTLNI